MNIDLNFIFNDIREQIEQDDILREKIIKLSRQSIRKCSESIRATHRREVENSATLLTEVKDLINQINSNIPESRLFENNASTAYQEFVEALLLHHFVFSKEELPIIPFKDVSPQISYVAYLHGLCDLVGELRRYILDSIRLDEINEGERALNLMDEIFSQLVTLDYPNALVPGIRRKTDLIRSLLEKSRGDLTLNYQLKKLDN